MSTTPFFTPNGLGVKINPFAKIRGLMKNLFVMLLCFGLSGTPILIYAEENFMKDMEEGKVDLVKDNPNIQKYEFVDNYLTILGILKENEENFDELAKAKTPAGQSAIEVMKQTRIAILKVGQIRELADGYKDSPNHMIAFFTRIMLEPTCDLLTQAYQIGLNFYEKLETITDEKSLQEFMLKNRDIEFSKMGTLYDTALEDLTKGSPMVARILLNPTVDKEGHVYFAITKDQIKTLNEKLKGICGEDIKKCEADIRQGNGKSWINAMATLLYTGLNERGVKTKDEVEGKQ